MNATKSRWFALRQSMAVISGRLRISRASLVVSLTAITILSLAISETFAYSFTHFGGRQGRAGVTDSLYTWNIGATGGQISWWFQRDSLTVDPGDGSGHATAAEFTAMQNLIQPELNKWGSWLDVTFVQAANAGAANVIIEFEQTFDGTGQAVPQGNNNDGAAAQYNSVTGATLNTAEVGLWPSNHWADNQADFSYVMLHEWGHILGLGDLYLGGALAGEDFIDHGFPSGPIPNTNGKQDSVMNTRGVMTLDNDDIAGAQWTMGGLGYDSLVTGKLSALGAGNNTTAVANHHGPNTWTYYGTSSVAALNGGTIVALDAIGVTAARDVGPGNWASQILPNKVIFTSDAGYAGNFIFELESTNPEGYISALITDNTPTLFTAIPAANGPQLIPHPMVFGPIPEPATLVMLLPAILLGVTGRRRLRSWKVV
jgi:hypothetical protein